MQTLVRVKGQSGFCHESCLKAKHPPRDYPLIDAYTNEPDKARNFGLCCVCKTPCVVKPRRARKPVPAGRWRLLKVADVKRLHLRDLLPGRECLVCYGGTHYWVDSDGNTGGESNWVFDINGAPCLPPTRRQCCKCGC